MDKEKGERRKEKGKRKKKSIRGLELNAKLFQWSQYKNPVSRPRMGKSQLRGVDNLTAKVDKVDIDRSGPIPDCPDPPEGVFNGVHPAGEVENIKFCIENRHLIKKFERDEFEGYIDRLRLNDRTRLHECRFRKGRKRGNRPC